LNLKAKHTIRDTITLPHPVSVKEVKVLVFAEGEAAEKAKADGADYVGIDEYIKKIEDGWMEFDVAIATPAAMKKIAKLGKYLGRKGLMPNPKTGTVTDDVAKAMVEFRKGKEEYRANKQGVIHQRIGKVSMSEEQIAENAQAFYAEIMRKKPSDLKGKYVNSVGLSSTMGPGVKVNYQSFTAKQGA
jgi:large subunit ribosomal protein L1